MNVGPGAAVPVKQSDEPVVGGKVIPVYGYTHNTVGERGVKGGAAYPVRVISDAEMASGEYVLDGQIMALPVCAAEEGAAVMGGNATPVYLVGGSLSDAVARQPLDDPVFAAMNTTATNDLTADGFSWAQANPLYVDGYGKLITLAQRNGGGTKVHLFCYSNDGGATWHDNALTEGYLERGSFAVDEANDVIHVLWNAAASSDGIIYRRYTITRDASHNITGISKDATVNLQMDCQTDGTMQYGHPVMIHLSTGEYGSLLAIWSTRNTGAGGGNEIRSSFCVLSSTADAGKSAENWMSTTGTPSSTSIGNTPAVNYFAIHAQSMAETSGIANASAVIIQDGARAQDIAIAYCDGATARAWKYVRLQWESMDGYWSGGLSAITTLSAMTVAGSDTGYPLKHQLGSKIVEDNGTLYFVFPRWPNNVVGDTVTLTRIDTDDGATLVNVYSAGGAHSYAPTCDVYYDAIAQRVVVSYIKTATDAAYIQTFDGVTQKQAETLAFDADKVDIPLIGPKRIGTKVPLLFREASGSAPYVGYFGTLEWE